MKKALVLTAMVLALGHGIIDPVFAADTAPKTVCTSTNVADGGFVFTLSPNGSTATLEEQTFAGPRPLADMNCEYLANTMNVRPDALYNYMICRDARAAEGGLIVRLFRGGIAGLHYASVRGVTTLNRHVIENELQFGHLNCQR